MEEIKTKVEKARVRLDNGQGVLIPGGMILTAAHCIKWCNDGHMGPEGKQYIEKVYTTRGEILLQPVAVETVKDIAVLGALDDEEFPSEYEKFRDFCRSVEPIPIATHEHTLHEPFDAYVLSHQDCWIQAKISQHEPLADVLNFKSEDPIIPGTSGGPVIDEAGQILGIVSHGVGDLSEVTPRPHRTLPVWVVDVI